MRQVETKVSAITPCPGSPVCRSGPFLQSNWSNFFHGFLHITSSKGNSTSSPQRLQLLLSPSMPAPFCSPETPCAHTLLLSEWHHLSGGSYLPQWAAVKRNIKVHYIQLSKWVTLWFDCNAIRSTYTFAVRWHLRNFRYFSKVEWLMEGKSHWK